MIITNLKFYISNLISAKNNYPRKLKYSRTRIFIFINLCHYFIQVCESITKSLYIIVFEMCADQSLSIITPRDHVYIICVLIPFPLLTLTSLTPALLPVCIYPRVLSPASIFVALTPGVYYRALSEYTHPVRIRPGIKAP